MVNSSYDIHIITFENFSLVLSQELQAFDFDPRISQFFSHGKNWYHLDATNFTGCFTGISWSLTFHIFFHRAKIIHFFAQGYNSRVHSVFHTAEIFHMGFTGISHAFHRRINDGMSWSAMTHSLFLSIFLHKALPTNTFDSFNL